MLENYSVTELIHIVNPYIRFKLVVRTEQHNIIVPQTSLWQFSNSIRFFAFCYVSGVVQDNDAGDIQRAAEFSAENSRVLGVRAALVDSGTDWWPLITHAGDSPNPQPPPPPPSPIIGRSCHKHHMCLSPQKYACRDKTFVATNTSLLPQKCCHDKHTFVTTKHMFVATKVSLSLENFCHDKIMFAGTNISFVATKIRLSQQACFCRDKRRVLSRQKWYFWQLPLMIPTNPSFFCLSVSPHFGIVNMYKPVTKAHRTFRGGEIHVWLSAFPMESGVEESRTLPWRVCDAKTLTFQSVRHLELCYPPLHCRVS